MGWQRKGALEAERRASEFTTVQWAVGVMGERRLSCAVVPAREEWVGDKQAAEALKCQITAVWEPGPGVGT